MSAEKSEENIKIDKEIKKDKNKNNISKATNNLVANASVNNSVPAVETKPEIIIKEEIEDQMKNSYLDYAMSVIVSRALPDVRDGLKPVHRRILFAMHELSNTHDKPYKKCARIVGETLGKYHPHGDSAVYETLVRMVQNFSLRYPLIEGQGNFGSIDGDNAAAMRYTEARMNKVAEQILEDLEKDTVEFVPNFDGSLKEPTILPGKVPNLMINGSSGIAVGMATNIPPHNIKEICKAVIRLIDNSDCTVSDIMQDVKGPDFPTGGMIYGTMGIEHAYHKGVGRLKVRAKISLNEEKKIIVDEIPYQVNKAMLLEQIAELVKEKKIEGITDVRDESDKDGMRIVIEVSNSANKDLIVNQLYKFTRLQTTFGIINLVLVNNEPKILGIKDLLLHFIAHRQDIIRKKTEFEMKKAQEKAHILEGLIVALNNVDDIIAKIKKSADVNSAHQMLIRDYTLSHEQAKAILEMRLQKLASLEQEKIRSEHVDLIKQIEGLKAILDDEKKILSIIKSETNELIQKYGDERRTQIVHVQDEELDIDIEDIIKKENVVVTITHSGYIKRLPIDTYKEQRRGGKGVIGTGTREGDFVEDLFVAHTHSYILFFTNKGKVHWLKVYKIPEGSRIAKGSAIVNLLDLEEGETVSAFVPVNDFSGYLFMATRQGTVKRIELDQFSRPRAGGILAILLDEGDQLMSVKRTDGTKEILVATKKGIAVKFNEADVRDTGRNARGVRGIRLKEYDEVVEAIVVENDETILTVTENGYGKRTASDEYRVITRGGVGVINILCSERNGNVIGVKPVKNEDSILLMSKSGIAIRTNVSQIALIGRSTQGVRIMKLEETDNVAAVARLIEEDLRIEQTEKEAINSEEKMIFAKEEKSVMDSELHRQDGDEDSNDSQNDSGNDSRESEDDNLNNDSNSPNEDQ